MNVTSTEPELRTTCAVPAVAPGVTETTVQPVPGMTSAIRKSDEPESTRIRAASPIWNADSLRAVLEVELAVLEASVTGAAVATVKGFTATEPPPDAVTGFGEDGTVVGVWSPEESCACWEPVTVRTLSALAGVVLLLSTLVFTMAAADPAVRTPTSERTVIARFCTW